LTIDEARVSAGIKYEDPGVGHLFPHVYGPIELSAVVKQEAMRRNEEGRWQLP
jgi:uncharacterized protein (DUF952 family)